MDMRKQMEHSGSENAKTGMEHKLHILSFLGITSIYIGNLIYQTFNWVEHLILITLAARWLIHKHWRKREPIIKKQIIPSASMGMIQLSDCHVRKGKKRRLESMTYDEEKEEYLTPNNESG
jgi:hypothetical protein